MRKLGRREAFSKVDMLLLADRALRLKPDLARRELRAIQRIGIYSSWTRGFVRMTPSSCFIAREFEG